MKNLTRLIAWPALLSASAAVALLTVPFGSTASAGERVSMISEQYYISDHADAIELEDGHTIILARLYGTQVSADTSSPMHQAKVDCTGFVDIRPDGWDASGYCMHTDRDGDRWVGKWRNGSAMKEGVYEVYHGTSGKYVGATGGGTNTGCTDLTGGPRGNTVCNITGEIVLK
jgi:hypothetical protein